jgi:endonuclease G
MNCTSKSAQAKLTTKNTVPNHKIKKAKERIEDKLRPSQFLLYPTSTTNQIIKHNYFTVSYSEKDEQPEWVFYKVSSNNYNKQISRTNDYREDLFVKTTSASPNDYHKSGYDMGHLAPAHAMGFNHTSMSESFYLSNISPQKASFNRGIWRSLEGKVEYWSNFKDSIYVVSGPVLDNSIDQIGENKIAVPRAFYKTLISFKDGEVRGIAFVIPNEKSHKSIYAYATSIDNIEKITSIDFYHELDKLIQDKVEANMDVKKWLSIK